ncbi:NAD(P)-dependent oxidoreductase [Mucilaginibacter paludis]|uniref:NAD-dependent epimerase/dehydratase n=1 Tax=Mucilaginibacter paludis DSM 18603 TaxID=714943 RepID=H1Y5D6_9SPHI|nr:NAD(P)-dependent oxidoreductase [Mucilaginibacter paludis]EHQ28947.1 NAD-dependent epimerase/dehydratase [Mucilaginibacter paludis DSM 18603]
MKIAIIGANGHIGSRILVEALNRGHHVTGIARNPDKLKFEHPNLVFLKGDALNTDELAGIIAGHDAVISSFGIDWTKPETFYLFSDVAQSVINATKKAGVKRLINVGGAGSLEVAPGVQLVDTPNFPAEWKLGADAQRKSLEVFRKENDLDWTFFSPAIIIEPGARTGKFRIGKDNPVFDAEGNSRITYDDYAAALIDELENPQFIKQRFTIGY